MDKRPCSGFAEGCDCDLEYVRVFVFIQGGSVLTTLCASFTHFVGCKEKTLIKLRQEELSDDCKNDSILHKGRLVFSKTSYSSVMKPL